MIFDTHAHYDDEAFAEDREELLSGLKANGVENVVNISASIRSVENTLELMRQYPFIYGAIGVHPSETEELSESRMAWLEEVSQEPKIVAIGEIGLDYHWDEPDKEVQKYWFVRQLKLARKVKLPVVIHSRDAAKDTLDIMKAEKAEEIGGVIHCFSYGVQMAREYLNMGFYLGIGGVVTFTNAKKLKEVVTYMPMDRLVLETDCPYLSPVPNRGKRNSSLNLPYVVKAVSELKGISQEEVIAITSENARSLYRISIASQGPASVR
ncbi:MAG: TatD family hydrolase [Hungatella sp.]|nr:TatD family hydrolase [Hungatella sp.]